MQNSENKLSRRPDVVLFVNGLSLAVMELKNATDEDATIWTAFQQLQTYKAEIGSLCATNAVFVVSNGIEARVGTLSAGREWFNSKTYSPAPACAASCRMRFPKGGVVLACHSAMSRNHYSLAMMPGAKKLRVETRK